METGSAAWLSAALEVGEELQHRTEGNLKKIITFSHFVISLCVVEGSYFDLPPIFVFLMPSNALFSPKSDRNFICDCV